MTSQEHPFANLPVWKNGGARHVAKIISDGGKGGKSRHDGAREGGDIPNVSMVFRQGLGQENEAPHREKDVEICGYSFWESGQPAHC